MKMNKCNHYRSSFLTPFIDKVPYDITNKHINSLFFSQYAGK